MVHLPRRSGPAGNARFFAAAGARTGRSGCSVLPRRRGPVCRNAARLMLMRPGPRAPRRCKFRARACRDSLNLGTGHRAAAAALRGRRGGAGAASTGWRSSARTSWSRAATRGACCGPCASAIPIVLHGVSMSLGSVDPLDERYLDALAALAREIEPAWISDHLCWSSFGGHSAHDLWPLPYTEEALRHVAARIARVQERLGRRILVENVSSYLTFRHSTMTRVGVPGGARRARRLRPPARRQQRVRQRAQPRLRSGRVHRRRAARARRAVSPGRAQRQGDAPARHARPSGVRRGLGAVSPRGPAVRRAGDAARARRRHPAARRAGAPRRGARPTCAAAARRRPT